MAAVTVGGVGTVPDCGGGGMSGKNINDEADERLSRLLLILELKAWNLTKQTRQFFSDEARFIRRTLGFED